MLLDCFVVTRRYFDYEPFEVVCVCAREIDAVRKATSYAMEWLSVYDKEYQGIPFYGVIKVPYIG